MSVKNILSGVGSSLWSLGSSAVKATKTAASMAVSSTATVAGVAKDYLIVPTAKATMQVAKSAYDRYASGREIQAERLSVQAVENDDPIDPPSGEPIVLPTQSLPVQQAVLSVAAAQQQLVADEAPIPPSPYSRATSLLSSGASYLVGLMKPSQPAQNNGLLQRTIASLPSVVSGTVGALQRVVGQVPGIVSAAKRSFSTLSSLYSKGAAVVRGVSNLASGRVLGGALSIADRLTGGTLTKLKDVIQLGSDLARLYVAYKVITTAYQLVRLFI